MTNTPSAIACMRAVASLNSAGPACPRTGESRVAMAVNARRNFTPRIYDAVPAIWNGRIAGLLVLFDDASRGIPPHQVRSPAAARRGGRQADAGFHPGQRR